MILLKFLSAVLKLQLAVELVPIVVIGTNTRLVHLADGSGTLLDSGRFGSVVVLALAPSTTARHLAINALLPRLCAAVERKEWAQLVLVDTVVYIADDNRLLRTQRVGCKSCARIEIPCRIHRQHLPRSAPVVVIILRLSYMF